MGKGRSGGIFDFRLDPQLHTVVIIIRINGEINNLKTQTFFFSINKSDTIIMTKIRK